jgi:hypothetical protein
VLQEARRQGRARRAARTMMTMLPCRSHARRCRAPARRCRIPTPAINAAKNAKAKTEAAQQKNAEALDPQPRAGAPPGAAGDAARRRRRRRTAAAAAPGYSYDPAGRRDPFVSLLGAAATCPPAARGRRGRRLLVSEVT